MIRLSSRRGALVALLVVALSAAAWTTLPTSPAAADEPAFADVDGSSQFYEAIQWMSSSGVSTGTPQPSGKPLYNPLASVSRQAMAAFLYRLSGADFDPPATSTFADVDAEATFYEAIEWMADRGISVGTAQPSGKPLFNPTSPVSRQAMAIFLARYSGVALGAEGEQSFADVPLGSAPAPAIGWMRRAGISAGTAQASGLPLYKPLDPVSRQAMAAFLFRVAHAPWGVGFLDFSLVAGSTTSSSVNVSLPADTEGLAAEVSGAAADFIDVDIGGIVALADGRWTLTVVADAAPDATEGEKAGSIQLESDDGPIGVSLPVRVVITVPDNETVPPALATVSSSETDELAGMLIAAGQIDVAIEASVADPDASIVRIAQAFGATIIGSYAELRLYQLRFSGIEPLALSDLAITISSDPDVAAASVAILQESQSDPVNDSEFVGQWGPGGEAWGQKMVHADEAWRLATGDGVSVGVIDGGFALGHEDLDDNIRSASGTGNRIEHGTHVAGLACAEGNNGMGIVGIAYQCDLQVRAVSFPLSTSSLVAHMDYLAGRASIINLSLGPSTDHDCTASGLSQEQLSADREIAEDRKKVRDVVLKHPDVLWVFAAGNGTEAGVGIDAGCGIGGALGQLPNVVSVAALDRTGTLTSYSNRGDAVTVAAPGGGSNQAADGLLSTIPHPCETVLAWTFCKPQDYKRLSGTSMAAPIVTGIAALAKSANPGITATQLRQCIIEGAEAGTVQISGQPFYLADSRRTVECAIRLGPPLGGIVTKTIPVTAPWGVAVDASRDRVYTVSTTSNEVMVINAITGQVIRTVPVATKPWSVTVDQTTNTIVIGHLPANGVGTGLTLINGDTFTSRTVNLGYGAYDTAVDETTGTIYVAGLSVMIAVDEATGSVLSPAIGMGSTSIDIAVDPATHRVYASRFDGKVEVIDGTTRSILTTLSFGTNVNALTLAINPVTDRLYVEVDLPNGSEIAVVDTQTDTVIGTIPSGGYGISVDVTHNRVYGLLHGLYLGQEFSRLTAFDGATGLPLQAVAVGHNPIRIGVNDVTGDLYVTDTQDNTLTFVQ